MRLDCASELLVIMWSVCLNLDPGKDGKRNIKCDIQSRMNPSKVWTSIAMA